MRLAWLSSLLWCGCAGSSPPPVAPAAKVPQVDVELLLSIAATEMPLPDLAGHDFVEVSDGGSESAGFLMSQVGDRFVVLERGRTVERYRGRSGEDGPSTWYSPGDFSKWVATTIAFARAAQPDAIVGARIDLLWLALAARSIGRSDEKRQLIEAFVALSGHDPRVTLRDDLSRRRLVAAAIAWDRDAKPEQMRALLDDLIHRFPESPAAVTAREWEKRIAPRVVAATNDALTARIESAISALDREHCGPGRFWEFSESQWPGDNAVGTLRAIGFTAVPALIELLSDEGFTRCVSTDEETLAAPTIERRGDRARDVLSGLARRNLDSREAAAAWWEKAQLGVEHPHDGGDPKLVEERRAAMKAGDLHSLAETTDMAMRAYGLLAASLTEAVARSPGENGARFLPLLADPAHNVETRLAAVEGLVARRQPVAGLIGDLLPTERGNCRPLCDEPFAIRRLSTALTAVGAKGDVEAAARIASFTVGADRISALLALDGARDRCADCKAIVDAALLAALDDTERVPALHVMVHGIRCDGPEVADVAALALASHTKRSYSCNASDGERAAIRAKLRR
jgi:hypothetical protein